ncbi:hypothetical protein [Hymenobacter arizonensis]|uniref:GIY-YIG domain-containing protein n=1 Tax=Hymenobacter arizonensis TaxID=1227077 RepID=A0A1I5YX29_HYMAR|nr:hypothetical protein [Hymenobacter arizonensis]SFQ48833.1 hypothetical protein SAMN04515668_2516 [Hymenobacter arizonensis]
MTSSLDLFCPDTGTDVFDLSPYDNENAPVVTHRSTGAKSGFKGTRASSQGYKIYVVVNAAGVHYVGCTCTRMSSRLNLGHMRHLEGKNGYHGYKWLGETGLQLYVFYLRGLAHPSKDEQVTLFNKQVAERIEAELVYVVRTATGKWPLSQHEIHFHNLDAHTGLAEKTTDTARQLYQQLQLRWPLVAEHTA